MLSHRSLTGQYKAQKCATSAAPRTRPGTGRAVAASLYKTPRQKKLSAKNDRKSKGRKEAKSVEIGFTRRGKPGQQMQKNERKKVARAFFGRYERGKRAHPQNGGEIRKWRQRGSVSGEEHGKRAGQFRKTTTVSYSTPILGIRYLIR